MLLGFEFLVIFVRHWVI